MNINFETFLLQCAAMGVWVFLVAGLYALCEKFVLTYFPSWLEMEEAGASQSPAQQVNIADHPSSKPS